MTKYKKIGGDLRPLPKDKRDFSLGGFFGVPKLKDLPIGDFFVGDPLEIKDQGNSDMCTSFATSAVLENHENVLLQPEYLFAIQKSIEGNLDAWGSDLRTAAKAASSEKVRGSGIIEKKDAPFSLETKDRDFLADITNWPEALYELANMHRQLSYFSVDGPYDKFDNFRAALKQHEESNNAILTGSLWEADWTTPDGFIPENPTGIGSGHAFKIFGQIETKLTPSNPSQKLYLVAQLSNGIDIGDKGIFYFPRNVVNKSFNFGAYMFKDINAETIKNLIKEHGFSDFILQLINWLRKGAYKLKCNQ